MYRHRCNSAGYNPTSPSFTIIRVGDATLLDANLLDTTSRSGSMNAEPSGCSSAGCNSAALVAKGVVWLAETHGHLRDEPLA